MGAASWIAVAIAVAVALGWFGPAKRKGAPPPVKKDDAGLK